MSRHGQPYAATNQFPHGQRFASIQPSSSYQPFTTATHHPPHGHTSLYGPTVRSPSPTNTTSHQPPHGQRYPGTSPAPPSTATHPPPGHYPRPPPASHSSVHQHWYRPSQNNRPGTPQGYSSMSPSQRYIYPSSQGYQSMNPSQGSPSINASQSYSSMNPSQGPPSMNPYSLQHPRYRSFHPRARFHTTQGPSFTHPPQRAVQSTGPQPSLRQQAPQQGSQLQQQMLPAYTQGQGEQLRYDSHVQGPHQAQGSQQLSTQRVEQQQRCHLSAQQEQNYQQGSHVQTMEQQVNKQPMQHKSPQRQQITGMPHHSMVDTMTEQFPQEETLREEERGQGSLREEVTPMNNPVTCVSDKEQLNLQGQWSIVCYTVVCTAKLPRHNGLGWLHIFWYLHNPDGHKRGFSWKNTEQSKSVLTR